MAVQENKIPPDVVEQIFRILQKGNTVELKKERGNLVVVEIRRQVNTKTPING